MRFTIFKAILVAATVAFAAACSNKGGGGATPAGISHDYFVRQSEVSAGGCLNMELLLKKINAFPDGTKARKFTTDISVQGTDGTNANFLTYLTRSTFDFEEKPIKDLMDFSSARQNGCHDVTLMNDQGNAQNYVITDSAPMTLTMQDQGNARVMTVSVLDETSLQTTFSYPAMDVCNNGTPANVTAMQVTRWGSGATNSQERVSVNMLKNLQLSTDSFPSGLINALSSATDVTVAVTTDDLKSLLDSPVRRDILGCFPPLPAPIPPPALPSASPEAAQPAASPSAAPASSGAHTASGAHPASH